MRVTIIGGNGKMGLLISNILKKNGVEVIPVGRKTKKTAEIIKKSDVIMFSIPLLAFQTLEDHYKKEWFKNKLVIDLSSQVLPQEKILKLLSDKTGFMHLLFGPDVHNIKNQNIIISNHTTDGKFKEIVHIFKKEGARITASTLKHHDYMMAYLQALSHFNSIALAKTISESTANKKEIENFSPLAFTFNTQLISRIIKQNSELYASIQFNNNSFKEILTNYVNNIHELSQIVEKKDYEHFDMVFNKIVAYWKDTTKNTTQNTNSNTIYKKNSLGVLGPQGSYSHEALIKYYRKFQPVFFDSLLEIINNVSSGKIHEALLPLENSLGGTVFESLDGIYYNNLRIVDERILDIRHTIAGLRKDTKPQDIKYIYSHPQALKQCAQYIHKHYPYAKLIGTESTSSAFKQISDEQLVHALAIGPKLCAKIYGLAIIKENIQDTNNNQTLFVIVTKDKIKPKKLPFVFMVIHPKKDKPGLLHDVLTLFKEKNINLLKLESRPAKDNLGSYIFYIKAEMKNTDKRLDDIMNKLHVFGKVTLMTN